MKKKWDPYKKYSYFIETRYPQVVAVNFYGFRDYTDPEESIESLEEAVKSLGKQIDIQPLMDLAFGEEEGPEFEVLQKQITKMLNQIGVTSKWDWYDGEDFLIISTQRIPKYREVIELFPEEE